jgi:hypothetical protein
MRSVVLSQNAAKGLGIDKGDDYGPDKDAELSKVSTRVLLWHLWALQPSAVAGAVFRVVSSIGC